ncbi:MFS general substrate transporter, partial [Lepidopterella palustris CBS 459.81]
LCLQSLMLGYMAAVFSIQMSSSVLTTINSDIGPSTAFAWLSTSQVLPVGVLGPLTGRLSDIFGRRNFILVGNIFGLIGCVVCATATRVDVAIGGGTFIGVASAFQQLAWTAVGELVPRKYRAFALGAFEMCALPPGAFGAIMGNAIAAHTTWRWVYWVPFILNTAGLFAVFLFYRPKNQYIREEGKTVMQELFDLDWMGFFLYGNGLLLLLLGISFGGNVFPWYEKSAGTICLIVIGALLLVAFGFYEYYWDQIFPLFPPVVMKKTRGVIMVLVGIFLFGMMYYSVAVLWPQQIMALYTTDLIKVGWYASALGMVGIVASFVSGYIFTRFGHARLLFLFIITVGTVAAGCMAIKPESPVASTIFVAMQGFTVGAGMIVSTAMVQMAVSHEYLGVTTQLAVTARNVGGAVGTVIYTSIFTGRIKANVAKYVAFPLAKSGVPFQSLQAVVYALIGQAPPAVLAMLSPAQLGLAMAGVKQAYVHSFRVVYLSSIAFGVLGVISVAFCKNVDHLMTNQVDIKLDEGAKLTGGVTDTGEGHIITIAEQQLHKHGHHHHNEKEI